MIEHLNAEQTAELLGIAKSTFLRKYAVRPDFPDRIRISRKIMFWKRDEVEAWRNRHREQRPKI
ncbi:Predicted transcriptional regulator [Kingella potus]|uniref:Predicted transcriptional regulator n=1 Tax=Kingella potus TaxID=265175 RepID=A0A377R4Y0_9NEIS|nr:AlpA family phage regulatory protein [Kingella potus]STR03032.1 Predicted transcriptional regulator [Kingella potus]STR03079.1 Predicted transcriptional regulator [Kingella potus]